MDVLLKLLEFLENFPIEWKIVFSIIFILLWLLWFFKKPLFKWIKCLKNKKRNKYSFLNHKIFCEKTFVYHTISMINVGVPEKSYIFRRILKNMYDSILYFSKELITNDKIYNLSNNQFYALVIKNITNIVNDYNDKILKEFGQELYNLVMVHEKKGFNIHHEKTILFIKNVVEEAFENDNIVYSTVEHKIDYLLDLYCIAMKIAMSDVDKLYKNFNGELEKILDLDIKNEEYYHFFAEASTEALFFSKNGVCIDCNKRAAEMFGYLTVKEFLKNIGIFKINIIDSKYHDLVSKHMKNNLLEPYDAIGIKKNGTTFKISIRAKLIPFKNKGIVRSTSIIDIS